MGPRAAPTHPRLAAREERAAVVTEREERPHGDDDVEPKRQLQPRRGEGLAPRQLSGAPLPGSNVGHHFGIPLVIQLVLQLPQPLSQRLGAGPGQGGAEAEGAAARGGVEPNGG